MKPISTFSTFPLSRIAAGVLGAFLLTAGAQAATTAAPATTPPATKTTEAEAAHPLKAVRLSKLEGVDVYDASNKKIGEIEDVMVDPKTGKVRHVILDIGGLAGIGGKKHAATIDQVKIFSRAPDDARPAKATVSAAADSMPAADMKKSQAEGLVESDKLVGTDVVDATGKEIGEIDDVVIDLQSGEPRFALMEFDKSWSPVDKLYAFQMSQFTPAKEKGKLMLDARKEQLESLPNVDKNALDRTDLSTISVGSTPKTR